MRLDEIDFVDDKQEILARVKADGTVYPIGGCADWATAQEIHAGRFARDVVAEFLRASQVHSRPFVSLHEGYGVLMEEVEEFWDEVKSRTPDPERAKAELVQIAAMAMRNYIDVLACRSDNDTKAKDEAFASRDT